VLNYAPTVQYNTLRTISIAIAIASRQASSFQDDRPPDQDQGYDRRRPSVRGYLGKVGGTL
jgi:hypothetical protein